MLFTLVSIQALAAQHARPSPSIEEAQIERAVYSSYISGLRTRDFTLIREICLPEAVLMSVREDGSLSVTTLDQWSRRFDPANPPFTQLAASITKIDREGTAAQVKVLFLVDGETRVTDFLHMLKVDGEWRVANIIDY
jgi:hypothetical protein